MEIFKLREINYFLNKHHRAKKTYILKKIFTIKDVINQAAQKKTKKQLKEDEIKPDTNKGLIQRRQIYYNNCGKPGYNARIYKVIIENFNEEDSI